MLPRKRLDIGWADLFAAAAGCGSPRSREEAEAAALDAWGGQRPALASLSVRSGFDALLAALDFPQGSEVLVSAITIRDMPRIVAAHGLVPVPVDLNPGNLSMCPEALDAAVTDRTRAVLFAHLYGGRASLGPLVEAARRRGLFLMEDCAQAYAGPGFRGHPGSDAALFSFGPIKTNTALGGAVLTFRDPAVRDAAAAVQAGWPIQPRREFLARLPRFAAVHALGAPANYALFTRLCGALGIDHDAVVAGGARGFAAGDDAAFLAAIRRRPSAPLLGLLARRLRGFDPALIEDRTRVAAELDALLPDVERPGNAADPHGRWVYPIAVDRPDELTRGLWAAGFDATRGASALHAVPPPPGRPAPRAAAALLARTLYLPQPPGASAAHRRDLAAAVRRLTAPNPTAVDAPEPTTIS